ncbi:hypothetical protein DYH09_08070 [bacterium CPR1]|nr:hypothetical protein [bacterium CPR1]
MPGRFTMIVTGLRTSPARPSLSSSTPTTATPASDPKDQISLERTELWKAIKNPTLVATAACTVAASALGRMGGWVGGLAGATAAYVTGPLVGGAIGGYLGFKLGMKLGENKGGLGLLIIVLTSAVGASVGIAGGHYAGLVAGAYAGYQGGLAGAAASALSLGPMAFGLSAFGFGKRELKTHPEKYPQLLKNIDEAKKQAERKAAPPE